MYDLVLLFKLLPNLRRPGWRGPLWQGKNNAAAVQLDFLATEKETSATIWIATDS